WDGSAKVVVEKAFPGASDSAGGKVTNNGTIDGNLKLSVTNVVDYENTRIEPEKEHGDDTTGTTEGELCGQLDVTVTYNGSPVHIGKLNTIGTRDLGTLAAGTSGTYDVSYTVNVDADNQIMTDKCEFDMQLVLSQL
ncbi:hypothetical protein ACFL16_02045, partial [Patescibacteria group bacterium]